VASTVNCCNRSNSPVPHRARARFPRDALRAGNLRLEGHSSSSAAAAPGIALDRPDRSPEDFLTHAEHVLSVALSRITGAPLSSTFKSTAAAMKVFSPPPLALSTLTFDSKQDAQRGCSLSDASGYLFSFVFHSLLVCVICLLCKAYGHSFISSFKFYFVCVKT
jgi:hypothetical protein